jgi:hypothetical protein
MIDMLRGIGAAAYVWNIALSIQFHEGLPGLEVGKVMSRETREIAVAYKAGLSIWQVDDAYDIISGPSSPRPAKLGGGNCEYSFETPELDTLAARLQQAGVEFAQKPRQLPRGARAIRVYDPDGHIIDIGSLHRSTTE